MAHRLRLHRPADFQPGAMRALPLKFSAGHPHIDALLDAGGRAQPVRLLVDTVSSNTLSLKPDAGRGFIAAPGGRTGTSCFIEGEVANAIGVPLQVDFGGAVSARVEEPVLSAQSKVHDPDVTGSIGASLLARFRYAIDFPGKRLWIGARTTE